MPEMILPGTYVEVRDEGLISAGRISTGNIGIVGTASKRNDLGVVLISSLSEAREKFGSADDDLTLVRSLQFIYQNGGRNVYAVCTGACSQYILPVTTDALAAGTTLPEAEKKDGVKGITLQAKTPGSAGDGITIEVAEEDDEKSRKVTIKQQGADDEDYSVSSLADLAKQITSKSKLIRVVNLDIDVKNKLPALLATGTFKDGVNPAYKEALEKLEKDIINIVVLAGQDTSNSEILTALQGHLTTTTGIKRERIGIMGLGFAEGEKGHIPEDIPVNDRLILVTPGMATKNKDGKEENLSSGYLAAAVAGLISSLPVHTSPTNKTLSLDGLTEIFNSSDLEKLVQKRLLVVEQRDGFRIVKGITTHDGAWTQITTRRIVDYAIYGVRSSCNPYIGKLNNVRVRGAMKATLDGFLSRMVEDEALVGYQLEVSANRSQELAGEAIVTMMLQPTFSIDFVKVTMSLS
jgi:hypothetical protein